MENISHINGFPAMILMHVKTFVVCRFTYWYEKGWDGDKIYHYTQQLMHVRVTIKSKGHCQCLSFAICEWFFH